METRFFHGSNTPLGPIVVFGGARKQGRKYGGFYMAETRDYAAKYGTVYCVAIAANAVIEEKAGDITRLSVNTINAALARGIDILKGIDPRGYVEYVVINATVIEGIKHD